MKRASRVRATFVAAMIGSSAAGCRCGGPRTDIPELRVPRAVEAPVLDGRLDDGSWAEAARTEAFVDTLTGQAVAQRVTARILRDERALYVAFEVEDDLLRCTFRGRDAHLWEQDAVELMIDPDGDGQRYLELQVSPTNLVFDTWFDTPRRPAPFGHAGYDSGLRSAVSLEGAVNDAEPDRGWTAEVAIPWSAFDAIAPAGASTGSVVPARGETWRVALYVLDAREEGQTGVGWSAPLIGDFHVPERFGRIRFE